ncbi:MAG TPA: MltA domain-containing protein [Vitreimonas sp.]|uniref:MltA domain-containing protein n=1 Tax=Vitreimonas sp. TaxID=3069702 RepID=UPI002D346A07|nr:MltA domain-containing protein [Vitreimonas sp.]HYD87292.1 MltA domain-containing protein [Vitreimonas sp.]
MKLSRLTCLAAAAALAACATTPTTETRPPETPREEAAFALEAAAFEDIPGWREADLAPALSAFRRTCDGRRQRDPAAALPGGGRYGGTVADWAPACAAAGSVAAGQERAFFEAHFSPHLVQGGGEARLTAYYEPIIQARRTPDAVFSAPLLRRPSDMVSVDLAAFAEAHDNETLRGAPRALTGQLVGNQVRPYPRRSEMNPSPDQAFAWAHPVDVYNLQIQGSGRIAFPDGTQARAAYAAQNGYRWRSALGALRDSGELPSATWDSFRAWSDQRGPEATRQALAADPSFVFFQEEQIADPAAGPRGAAGVPLTPLGSIAVDPAYHPYGAIVFVDGQYDGQPFRRLLVAQDTGGAIRRGPMRGDVFFGSGDQAGEAAERMNAPARWWTLLPRGVPVA